MKQSIGAKALIVPTPVWVVGTYDHEDQPNVMTAAWGGICCSKPPCVAIAVQKIRYTYNNSIFIFSDRIYRIAGILFACGDMPSAEGRSISTIRLILSDCFSKIRRHSQVTFGMPQVPNPS